MPCGTRTRNAARAILMASASSVHSLTAVLLSRVPPAHASAVLRPGSSCLPGLPSLVYEKNRNTPLTNVYSDKDRFPSVAVMGPREGGIDSASGGVGPAEEDQGVMAGVGDASAVCPGARGRNARAGSPRPESRNGQARVAGQETVPRAEHTDRPHHPSAEAGVIGGCA